MAALRNPRLAVAFALAATLVAAGSFAAGLLASPGAPGGVPAGAADGDEVWYDITAYGEDGQVLFTSDRALAEREAAAGNALVAEQLSALGFGPRNGTLSVPPAEEPEGLHRFQPSVYLAGHRPGDTIGTPFFLRPFGPAPGASLPRALGPLPTEFEMNLTRLYAPGQAELANATFGPRSAFVPGGRVPYAGVLEAIVLSVEDGHASMRMEAEPGAVAPSRVLGLPVRVEPAQPGNVTLHPLAEVGDTFATQGCSLPDGAIPPGRYRVESANDTHYRLRMDTGALEPLFTEPMRFEITLVAVEKPQPPARGGFLAGVFG